eukprot:jgi/Mesen1/1782/ME000014S01190
MTGCPYAHLVSPGDASAGPGGVKVNTSSELKGACPYARVELDSKEVANADGKPAACSLAKSLRQVDDVDSTRTLRNDNEEKNGERETDLEEALAGDSGTGGTASSSGKCPFGYDTATFEIGPLSCMICKALLFESSRCVPCRHIFCRGCVMRFRDCPLCGADIDSLAPDEDMQALVDRFVEGHVLKAAAKDAAADVDGSREQQKEILKKLDVAAYNEPMAVPGSFLLQHAMRAFQAGNVASAKQRLLLCLGDLRDELAREGAARRDLSCQLGAVLGSLGDCSRIGGDADEAGTYYEDAAQSLAAVEDRDAEVVHALAVSWNKLGDLRYYARDLEGARVFYEKALTERRAFVARDPELAGPSQVLDVAVSLAKVADVDRAMGNAKGSVEGFQEAAETAEKLHILEDAAHAAVLTRRASTLHFIREQLDAALKLPPL